jgi:PPK2 family polyphosphate:nucleotide phosphotransferase
MGKVLDSGSVDNLGPSSVSDTYLDTLRSACLCRPTGFRLRQWPTHSDQQPSKEDLQERMQQLSERMDVLFTALHAQGKHRVLVILQGTDTSGKDGTARAILTGLHPMAVRMASFKVPSADENAHDFLWRIHQQVPRDGECVIFNRSHYDALIVPMVYAKPGSTWLEERAKNVLDFERLLAETGTTIVKFFLHISSQEQHLRMVDRWNDPSKRWKLTTSDLQAAEHFSLYTQVHEKVISSTHADCAPWWIVPADHKGFRNMLVAEILVGVLERMNLKWPAVDPEVKASGFWKL